MASKQDIITLPHSSLRKRSRRVGLVDSSVQKLIANMEAATLDWEDSRSHEVGVALAGVQIDKLLRVVVVRNNFDDKKDRTFMTLINPEITKYEGDVEEDYEGCLSILDTYGKVARHTKVRVKALGLNGSPIRITAEGFLARVLQHEVDHINGIVFIDHIKDQKDAFYRLNDDGKLVALDYDTEIKDNPQLWSL
ncbi:MAG: peptide deformylase [bacterium]|nr:peptide deformylase [bacterium]